MFGWLKRRVRTEHRKLSYQNFVAATDPEMRFLSVMKGGFDPEPIFDRARTSAMYLIEELAQGRVLSNDDVALALDLNKELRRIFDNFGRADRGGFDKIYRPLGGWDSYFERSSNEKHLLICDI